MLVLAMSATTKTLIVAIVGIVVSGIVGPWVTAWATRRANRQQFDRDLAARRRDDFRGLVDEAAKALGAGVTNLRLGREAKEAGAAEPDLVKQWASDVHLLRQRLLLRRRADSSVMTSYANVLEALGQVGAAVTKDDYNKAVDTYTRAMENFLSSARATLELPVE